MKLCGGRKLSAWKWLTACSWKKVGGKFMKQSIIILILLSGTLVFGQSSPPIDTVKITMTSLQDNGFYPHRACVGPYVITFKNPSQYNTPYYDSSKIVKGHLDSIKVNFQVINKNNQPYYLIVLDSLHRKRLEGMFYDRFPNGNIIEYYENGNIRASGLRKLTTEKKRILVCEATYCCPKIKFKHYENRISHYLRWDTYNENNQLIRSLKNSIETNETWETIYDSSGKLISTIYYKNGKKKNR